MLSEFKPPHSIWNKGSNSVDLLVTWKTSIQELDNHVADNTPNQNIPLRRMSQRRRRFTESLQKYFRWVWRRWQCRCMGYDVRESTPKISIFLTIFEVTETNPSCPAAKRTMRVYNRKSAYEYTRAGSPCVAPHVTRACPIGATQKIKAHIVYVFNTAPCNPTAVKRHESRAEMTADSKVQVHIRSRHDRKRNKVRISVTFEYIRRK